MDKENDDTVQADEIPEDVAAAWATVLLDVYEKTVRDGGTIPAEKLE